MKKYLYRTRSVCCLLLISLCYLLMRQSAQKLEEYGRSALVALEYSALRASQVQKMEELEAVQDEPVDFAAWGQEKEVTVENRDLRRIADVSVVDVFGRSDMVLAGSAWLDEGDRDGCLLDEKTAQTLFGSLNVVGQTITVKGSQKIIRGFLHGVSGTVLVKAGEEQELTSLTISMGEGMTYENLRQTFLARHGLQGRIVRMDILPQIAQGLCFLVLLFVSCRLFFGCVRCLWAYREENRIFAAVGIVVCAAVLLAFLAPHVRLPADMIPTKWSDFSFWGDWWGRRKEELLYLMLTEKQKPMQPALQSFYRVCGWFAGALIFLRMWAHHHNLNACI